MQSTTSISFGKRTSRRAMSSTWKCSKGSPASRTTRSLTCWKRPSDFGSTLDFVTHVTLPGVPRALRFRASSTANRAMRSTPGVVTTLTAKRPAPKWVIVRPVLSARSGINRASVSRSPSKRALSDRACRTPTLVGMSSSSEAKTSASASRRSAVSRSPAMLAAMDAMEREFAS